MGPAVKRRKLESSKVEEVVFDNAARHDYLTGFHKRKVQRTKMAQEAAVKRARQERIDDRKRIRDQRKADLEQHVQEVNRLLHPNTEPKQDNTSSAREGDSDDNWSGIEDEREVIVVDHEDEYVDEDKYTTVTVEEIDVTRNGLVKAEQAGTERIDVDEKRSAATEPQTGSTGSKATPAKKKNNRDKPDKTKKKRKKFRYESKADRTKNHLKARAKNSQQARARRKD